jgi:hypothetical protein
MGFFPCELTCQLFHVSIRTSIISSLFSLARYIPFFFSFQQLLSIDERREDTALKQQEAAARREQVRRRGVGDGSREAVESCDEHGLGFVQLGCTVATWVTGHGFAAASGWTGHVRPGRE